MSEAKIREDALLTLMGEGIGVEFKLNTPSADRLAELIVDFANEAGGKIIIGVGDRGEIKGASSGAVRPALDKALRMIEGSPDVKLEAVRVDGKKIFVITVDPLSMPAPLKLNTIASRPGIRRISAGGSTGRRSLRDVEPLPVSGSPASAPAPDDYPPDAGDSASDPDEPDEERPGDSTVAGVAASPERSMPQGDGQEQEEGTAAEDGARTSGEEERTFYHGRQIQNDLSDRNFKPGFNVDRLAAAFFKVLKNASSDSENVCFLGVFGVWGRGKTFFLKRLREIVGKSEDSECFDFVTFNAWKYQETPGIWASLIETLLSHKSCWGRLRYKLTPRVMLSFLSSLVLLAVATACGCLALRDWKSPDITKTLLGLMGSMFALIASVMGFIKSFGWFSVGDWHNFNPKDHLGVQYQTEKELERIVGRWNWGHITNAGHFLRYGFSQRQGRKPARRIVLLVEDIDRCRGEKMIAIIEALKLIMENPRIAKRIIVIMSVDQEKAMTAYRRRFEAEGAVNPELCALEQMNKIFLMGMRLPKISKEDVLLYLDIIADKLLADAGVEDGGLSGQRQENVVLQDAGDSHGDNASPQGDVAPESSGGDDASAEDGGELNAESGIAENPGGSAQPEEAGIELSNRDAIRLLKRELEKKVNYGTLLHLTPRQIKILFYRLVLANNLMTDYGVGVSPRVIEQIVNFSLNDEGIDLVSHNKIGEIMQVVVPFGVTKIAHREAAPSLN